MRHVLLVVAFALFAFEAGASECRNGRCGVVRSSARQTVQTVRNASRGAVQVVTPPYRGRCANGKCSVR